MTDANQKAVKDAHADIQQIRTILDKHYNPSLLQRFLQGLVRGLGFAVGGMLVVVIIVMILATLVRQIELFPDAKAQITNTLDAVQSLWPSREN